MYKDHTNGSEIKIAKNSVSWNFSHADPELGAMQADQLQKELEEILGRTMPQAQVARKLGFVSIYPKGQDKGAAVQRILQRYYTSEGDDECEPPDFVVCFGYDAFDEPMYQEVYKFIAAHSAAVQHCFTCTVKRKPSHAHMFVNSNADVEQLLISLV